MRLTDGDGNGSMFRLLCYLIGMVGVWRRLGGPLLVPVIEGICMATVSQSCHQYYH